MPLNLRRNTHINIFPLQCYPEPNCGWMNEDGTRIDMQHRLIPKLPLRSALKRSRGSSGSVEQVPATA